MTDTWIIFAVISSHEDMFIWDLTILSINIRTNVSPSADNTTTFIFLFPWRDTMKSQKHVPIWRRSSHHASWDHLRGDKVGRHIVSTALLFSRKPTWLCHREHRRDGPLLGRQLFSCVAYLSFVFKFNITIFSKPLLEDPFLDEILGIRRFYCTVERKWGSA